MFSFRIRLTQKSKNSVFLKLLKLHNLFMPWIWIRDNFKTTDPVSLSRGRAFSCTPTVGKSYL